MKKVSQLSVIERWQICDEYTCTNFALKIIIISIVVVLVVVAAAASITFTVGSTVNYDGGFDG